MGSSMHGSIHRSVHIDTCMHRYNTYVQIYTHASIHLSVHAFPVLTLHFGRLGVSLINRLRLKQMGVVNACFTNGSIGLL